MNKLTRKWTLGACLALALCCLTAKVGRGDDDEEEAKKLKMAMEAAKKAVESNLDKVGGPALEAVAGKLAMDHPIESTMKLFKPKAKGGMSIGGLVKAGHKDSIELLIRDYTIKPPTKAEVANYNDDLVKSAKVVGIIAEMTPYWAPKKDVGPKTKAKWLALTKEMKEGSADLIAASKSKDEKAVETAAKRLNASCAECHKIFRDDK